MTFTESEKQLIQHGRATGKRPQEIEAAINKLRQGFIPPEPTKPTVIDYIDPKKALNRGANVVRSAMEIPQKITDTIEGSIIGEEALAENKERRSELIKPITDAIAPVAKVYEENVPQPVKDLISIGTVALPFVKGANVTSFTSRFTKAKTVDEIIDTVDATPLPSNGIQKFDVPEKQTLEKIKTEAPIITAKERFAGVRPDIKARIQGKEEQLKSYFDVAEARNLSDQAPYPFEVGARRVDLAQQKLESILDDTGGKIGQFRQKISTYKAYPEDVKTVDNSFLTQLDKLNLEIRNGSIVKKQGKIAKTVNDAEINTLQSLYDDFLTYKKSPTIENAIALRDKFNNKINFGKSSQEVSGNIDPLSRAVRAKIKEVASKQVGKSEAKNLDDYARLMEALSEVKSYTDRRAGGEFLIKQVLSERGGDSRAIIETIKNETGIDLMDDAVMARLATDIVGNDAQKGLFRQEIARAGLDAKALATGDVKGIISAIYQRGADWLIDPKEVYLESARSKPLPKQSSPKKQKTQPSQKTK